MFGFFKRERRPEEAAPARDFRMEVEDVFSIPGRGSMVTGTVQRGRVRVGDRLCLAGKAGRLPVRVSGIESSRRALDAAGEGQAVGILLRGVEHGQAAPGDVLSGV